MTGRALVTGASGFIGRHLVAALRVRGVPVRAYGRRAGAWPGDVEAALGEIDDARALAAAADGVDVVYHLAGKVHDLGELADTGEHARVTVGGTAALLEACARHRPAVVFLSTLAVYGETGEACVDEDVPPRPVSAYGRAKLEAEALVHEWGARTGSHVCVLRPPMVYGAGCKGNLIRMVRAVDRGWFPPLRDVGNRRSLVGVEDVVAALQLAASHPAARGRRFIVTDGHAYSSREIYDELCRALGRTPPGWGLPIWPLQVAARAGDWGGRILGRRLPLDSSALQRLIGSAWFSSERIGRELGFVPHTRFALGAASVVEAYRRAA